MEMNKEINKHIYNYIETKIALIMFLLNTWMGIFWVLLY